MERHWGIDQIPKHREQASYGAIQPGLDQHILVCPHEYLGNFDFLGGGFK